MLEKVREWNIPWIVDPVSKLASVSLTLVVISFGALLIGAGLEISEVTKTTSVLSETFYGCLATYLGRRLSIGTKQFSGDNPTTQEPSK